MDGEQLVAALIGADTSVGKTCNCFSMAVLHRHLAGRTDQPDVDPEGLSVKHGNQRR